MARCPPQNQQWLSLRLRILFRKTAERQWLVRIWAAILATEYHAALLWGGGGGGRVVMPGVLTRLVPPRDLEFEEGEGDYRVSSQLLARQEHRPSRYLVH
jgi:hypothetical protein